MIELYLTENNRIYEKLTSLLPPGSEIKRTENGKPYTDGINFSITHTGDTAIIAISDMPVGIDAEIRRERPVSSTLNRFTAREQAEIGGHTIEFLRHWVVKEAYIKLIGGTIAHDLKRLEYFKGELFSDGVKVNCNILCTALDDLIYCVCSEEEIPRNLKLKMI